MKALQKQLQHVYWIGGGSGAGKSTIAHYLANKHNLQIYATDDVMPDHGQRMTPEDYPFLYKFIEMDMDERWVNRSPKKMLETFHWFQGEGFDLIVEDLLQMPGETGIVVDGFRLLPHLVEPLLTDHQKAVWLLPTPEFREAVFSSRWGNDGGFISKTSNREQALQNLLERDAMFTERLRVETSQMGMNTIEVNNSMTVDDLVAEVEKIFGL